VRVVQNTSVKATHSGSATELIHSVSTLQRHKTIRAIQIGFWQCETSSLRLRIAGCLVRSASTDKGSGRRQYRQQYRQTGSLAALFSGALFQRLTALLAVIR
jgi:hypothetical protein